MKYFLNLPILSYLTIDIKGKNKWIFEQNVFLVWRNLILKTSLKGLGLKLRWKILQHIRNDVLAVFFVEIFSSAQMIFTFFPLQRILLFRDVVLRRADRKRILRLSRWKTKARRLLEDLCRISYIPVRLYCRPRASARAYFGSFRVPCRIRELFL